MPTMPRLLLATAGLLALTATASAADTSFCGRASGDPAALREEISKAPGMKEVYRGPEYVAYQDAATQAVFTFSEPAQGPAHPAAVCRKPERKGDDMVLDMVIVCRGATEACQRLESDFKLLNAQMEAAVRAEAAKAGGK